MARRFSVEAVLEAKDRASPVIGKAVRSVRTLSRALLQFVSFNLDAIPIIGRFVGRLGRLQLALKVALPVAVVAATLALAKLFKILREGAKAFAESERAISNFEASLRSAGSFSREASREIQDFANDLQKSTTATQSQILELVALAKGFGASNEQAKALAATSLDFAAGAQLNLTEATRRLGRALQGSAADVANFAPEIRNLTSEQLRLGAATDLIAEKFRGRATAALGTYLGAVQNLENAQTRLDEAQGKLIIGSGELNRAILTQARLTDDLTAVTEKSRLSFVGLVVQFQQLRNLGTRLNIVFTRLGSSLAEANFSFGQAIVNLARNALGFGKAAETAEEAAELLREEFRKTIAESEDLTGNLATLTASLGDQEAALDVLFAAYQRTTRITKEQNEAAQALDLTLQRLGVRTLKQVELSLKQNEIAQRRVEAAFDDGKLGVAAYESALADLALEAEGLQAVLDGTAASVEDYKLAVEKATREQESSKRSTDALSASTTGLRRAQDEANRSTTTGTAALAAQAVQAALTASQFDALARSQGRQAAVQAALAAGGRLELGGTRVTLGPFPGSGSRLVRETGPSAFERDTGAIFLR